MSFLFHSLQQLVFHLTRLGTSKLGLGIFVNAWRYCRSSIAAWLVRIVPSHLLGVLVGGLIIFTNIRTLLTTFKVDQRLFPFLTWQLVLSLLFLFSLLFVIIPSILTHRQPDIRMIKNKCYLNDKNTARYTSSGIFYFLFSN